MKNAFILFMILPTMTLSMGTAHGAKIAEEFFNCVQKETKRSAKVFIDPDIFCDNKKEHKARLLLTKEGESKIYDGTLYRWNSGKGESFVYPNLDSYPGKKLTLTLPYGVSTGVLAETYKGETTNSIELKCVTREIHVSCD